MRGTQELKKPIRAFMQTHYTDERLAQLLCHARDGKLNYMSCCCFIGIVTAPHALRSDIDGKFCGHECIARSLPGAREAEYAFSQLDCKDQRVLIPMIRAEMKRREKPPAAPQVEQAIAESVVHAEVVE